MVLAEEAYVMDFCKRLDRADILPGSLASYERLFKFVMKHGYL